MVLKTETSSLLFLIISVCLVFSCLLWILSRQYRFLLESKKTNYNEEESIGNNITKQLNKIDTTPSVNDTTPSVNDTTTPSVNDTTPSVNDTTPSVNDTTPSVNDTTPSVNDTTCDDSSNFYFYLFIGGIVSCVAVYVYTILRQPKLEPKSILSYSDVVHGNRIEFHKDQKRRPIISSSITKFGKEKEYQRLIIDVFDVELETVVSDNVVVENKLQTDDEELDFMSEIKNGLELPIIKSKNKLQNDDEELKRTIKTSTNTFWIPPRFCIYLYLPIVQFLHVFVVVFVFVGVTIYYFLQKEEKKQTTITIYTIYAVCVLFVILMTIYRIVHALQIGKTKYLTGSGLDKLKYSFYEDNDTYSKTVDSPSENSPKYTQIKIYYNALYNEAPKEYEFISLSRKGVDFNDLATFYRNNLNASYEMYFKNNQNENKSLEDKVMDILGNKLEDYKRPEQRQHI